MQRAKLGLLMFMILPVIAARAVDVPSVPYATITELLEWYGIDVNEGLTALPSLNVPMGGRSEAMGTAFAAVADDASFLEWNPAGSSTLPVTELAFFHNNWIQDSKVEGAVFATRKNALGLAVGGKWLYLPFTETDSFGNRASKGYYAETTAVLNASYNLLAGYYFSGISLGANLKGSYRFVPDFSDNEGTVVPGSGASQSTFAAMADFGLLTRFNLLKFYYARERNSSFALVIRNFGPPALDEPMPTVATAAVSYRPIRPVLAAFDFSVPINLMDPALSERPYAAIGASAAITKFLSMRAGLLYRSSNLRLSVGSGIALEGIDLDVTYTLDLLTQLTPLNRVSLAARFDFGDGGRAERARKVDELYLKGLEEYANGNPDEALRLWKEVLDMDPRFDPAREGTSALLASRALEKRIDEIQKLE
ncbi:MAG: hypothetical protein A2Z99_07085 [Treponema sp. GWB1_62_6]|nr:MAG: hypothetical protein A2Y36_14905 [Treponema sp. GWA1_62_8]OHE66572.1 MAG: hypothetical protein A2Z99_07085 [Treponema sp. GWB1_62_6]OHE67719.1 MAG: hypothetical protein A2001_19585 [Treponema sp. GWC1_61_84]OHE71848.1 MAG: hypothetical protein A2413_20760 [Treponema sp. RIFOXYC1_FULL_61_9]HCM29028.1 hypothetical protein [Treponema sp.]